MTTTKPTPSKLLKVALAQAELHLRNPWQTRIFNTGNLNLAQCQRLATGGRFFDRSHQILTMRANNCHGNSIELVGNVSNLRLWTGFYFLDRCSDGTNGWMTHSWVVDHNNQLIETCLQPDPQCPEYPRHPGAYYGIELTAAEVLRWSRRNYA